MAAMKMVLMGTGTSHGVPVVSCTCEVCRSPHKEDKRLRCSAYVENEGNSSGAWDSEPGTESVFPTTNVVIDVGPEFRIQALATGIIRLDGVLITHSHADHCHGLDDIRIFSHTRPAQVGDGTDLSDADEEMMRHIQKRRTNWRQESVGKGIPIFANDIALNDIAHKFDYVFHPRSLGGGIPKMNLIDCARYSPSEELCLGSLRMFPVPMMHGTLPTVGWVLHGAGSNHAIAYLTDCSSIPDSSIGTVLNSGLVLDHLVIDALRVRPHSTHCCFSEAMSYAERLGATHTWFTHMTHDLFHTEIQSYIDSRLRDFPSLSGIVSRGGSVSPAYDGLVLLTEK